MVDKSIIDDLLIECLNSGKYENLELLILRAIVDPEVSKEELKYIISDKIVRCIASENLIDLFKLIYPYINISNDLKNDIIAICNDNESWLIVEYIETMESPINTIKMVNESLCDKYKLNGECVEVDDNLVIVIKHPIHWDESLKLLDKNGIIYSKYYDPYDAMASEFAKKRIRHHCLGKGLSTNEIDIIVERNLDFAYNLYYDRVLTIAKEEELENHIFDQKTYKNIIKFPVRHNSEYDDNK